MGKARGDHWLRVEGAGWLSVAGVLEDKRDAQPHECLHHDVPPRVLIVVREEAVALDDLTRAAVDVHEGEI